jgi:hypothetical protein
MKLRIRGNSLRFRLTRGEVAELVRAGSLEETVQFASGSRLIYSLRIGAEAANPVAALDGARITVALPAGPAKLWAESEEVGIYSPASADLEIVVEKDFKCLEPRPGEDQSDAFDNPKAACGPDGCDP